jgi:catalase
VGNQEGIHALMMLFSNRGIPKSARELNGYSGHTYKFTKDVSDQMMPIKQF